MGNPIHAVDRELSNVVDLKTALASENLDETELLDAIAGETDFLEALDMLDSSLLEDETQLAGLDATITRLQARAGRHEKTIKTKRGIMAKAMERAELKTVKTTAGTLTLGRSPRKVVIMTEEIIPDEYMVQRDPTPDKRAIKKALDEHKPVLGCQLSNGDVKLTIRRS